jgi:hypothetical protein
VKLAFKEGERQTSRDAADRFGRIRCPRCQWQPGRDDRWSCKCGHSWNTFDTHGVCPACAVAWRETQCLRCGQWSPHEDWYATSS